VEGVDNPKGEETTHLGITSSWQAHTIGRHSVVVRAFSTRGVEGQASVFVEVVEGGPRMIADTLGEGETLESIAQERGMGTDDLLEFNPGLNPDELSEGDIVIVPGGDGLVPNIPSGNGEEVPDDEEPGIFGDALDLTIIAVILDFLGAPVPDSDEPIMLRMDVLSLETFQAYESVHCYVGLGDMSHRWYPDLDGDQSSEEYFNSADGISWEVEEYLADHNALGIYWPGNQALSFEIICVGILGGGTQSLDLGPLFLTILPEMWDGTIRIAGTESGEGGGFSLSYRVYPGDLVPKGPNRDMARPVDLWINHNSNTLNWEYWPEEDEEMADGFLIFINETVVLQEDSEARRTPLPEPWLHPPCGEEYEFYVVAFINPYDLGDHSVPREEWEEDYQGDRLTIQGGEPGTGECDRTYAISFLSLQTGAFPDEESTFGSGPVDGILFTSRSGQLSFHHWGILPNAEYNLGELSTGPTPSLLVSFAEGEEEDIEWGFNISGLDVNGNNYGLMCEGGLIYPSSWFEDIIYHESTIPSDGGPAGCSVDYAIHLVEGSPIGLGGDVIPLPQLELNDLSIEPTSGQLQIHIRNIGMAEWTNQDLDVRVTNQSGDIIYDFHQADFYLEVGDEVIIQGADLVPADPSNICVILDYEDQILELYEHTGAFFHNPVCASRPDLSIDEVVYDYEGERLVVTVKNNGEQVYGLGLGELVDRDLILRLEFPDSTFLERRIENITLGCFGSTRIEWPELGPEVRDQMYAGYTISLDPGNEIVEVHENNNDYMVDGGTRLWLAWNIIEAPSGSEDQVEYRFLAYAVNGDYRRQIIRWYIEEDINWDHCGLECRLQFGEGDYSTDWFDIYGDEDLEVRITAFYPGALIIDEPSHSATWSGPGWGGGQLFDPVYCVYHPTRDPGHYSWTLRETGDRGWESSFSICRENFED